MSGNFDLSSSHFTSIDEPPPEIREAFHYSSILVASELRSDPEIVRHHFDRLGRPDSVAFAHLSLAYLRHDESEPAMRFVKQSIDHQDIRDLDRYLELLSEGYCGDLLDERLEIARLWFASERGSAETESAVVELHRQYGQCEMLLDELRVRCES